MKELKAKGVGMMENIISMLYDLSWDFENHRCHKDGEEEPMLPTDCITIPIRLEGLLMLNEEWIECDAILYYGDGTMELHSYEDQDAYNIYDFSLNTIKTAVKKLYGKWVDQTLDVFPNK